MKCMLNHQQYFIMACMVINRKIHIECNCLFLSLKMCRLSADKMFMNLSYFLLQHYMQHCQCENYETFSRHMWLLKCMLLLRVITVCFVCCLWTV